MKIEKKEEEEEELEASRLQVQVQTTAYMLTCYLPTHTHTHPPTFLAFRVCSKLYTCTESSDKTREGAWRGRRVPT